MCVIIYSKIGTEINENELKEAWETNPDGAGYAVIENNKVNYKKGFMKFKEFLNSFRKYNNKNYEKIVHFRITSKGSTNKRQTHPFKKNNPNITEYTGKRPVYFMNGTISDLTLEKGLNDTATYIRKYRNGIKANQQGIDILSQATSCRWAVATPRGIFVSDDFIKENDLYYSNLNHKYLNYYYSIKADPKNYYKYEYSLKEIITNKKLRKQIYKDKILLNEVEEFIYNVCNNYLCYNCPDCISYAKNIEELEEIINNYK